MNFPKDAEPVREADNDLAAQQKRLRMLTHAIAVSVLILTGTMFVFLYRQVVLVRRQTGELGRYINEVQQSGMPAFVDQVRAKLNEYRKTHPDFNPIYMRFFGTNEPSALTEKVTTAPASLTNK